MATVIPVVFKASPLPQNFKGTPQQFQDALVARLSIEATASIAFYTTGSVAPASNTGAWLKNGVTWYVWDVVTGAYIPEVIEAQSLKYIAQVAAPDPTKYTFWIVLDGGGVAQSIKYYSGGTWNDVYASTFANIYTKAQSDAAIAAAIATSANVAGKAAFSAISVASQNFVFAAPGNTVTQLVFGTEQYDPDSAYAPGTGAFVAPATGFYDFAVSAFFSVTAGAPTGNAISVNLLVNGNPVCSALSPDSSTTARIYNLARKIALNLGDTVTVSGDVTIGGASGTWTCSAGYWTSFDGTRLR